MSNEKKIEVTCEAAGRIDIDLINDFQDDFKIIDSVQLTKLKKSLLLHGFSFPAFLWKNPKDNKYYNIDSHQRIKALRQLRKEGYEIPEIPYSEIYCENESVARERLLAVCSVYGRYDTEGVKSFLCKIDNQKRLKETVDLAGVDLDKVLTILNEKTDPEFIPPVDDSSIICQPNDLWYLDKHKIICGDSTDPKIINRLFGGEKAFLMCTDPPYNVHYDGGVWRQAIDKSSNRRYGSFENDNRSDWSEVYRLFIAHGGQIAYVWHAGVHAGEVQKNLEDSGFEIRGQIIWVKQHFVMSRGAYHWQHEPCWYAVKKGSKAEWAGDRKQTSTWFIDNSNNFGGSKDDINSIHSCQKPLETMSRAIRNHGKNGDIVFDAFVGSGTCLISCEREQRRCFACELDPKYVDLSIQRWMAYTGKDAVREDGKSYKELLKEQQEGGK